jgi:ATP-independent RNA helicase DbpA
VRVVREGLALSITSLNDAEHLCQIEELMGKPLFREKIEALVVPSEFKLLRPSMVTLRLMAGRKDKIRPGDILGALTKEAGLNADMIGKIDILTLHAYVAIEKSQAQKAYDHFKNGKIKGKKIGVEYLA